VFTNSANLTNARASVEVLQVTTGVPADTQLALCLNSQNFYMIVYETGDLYFQDVLAGVRTGVRVPYDAVLHKIWRIRHDQTADTIVFETSANGTNWHAQRTIARQMAITSMRAEVSAGTWRAVTAPGTAIFDNFRLESNSGLPALTSPQLVANAAALSATITSVRNPTRVQTQMLVSSIQAAYTAFASESSRFTSASTINTLLSNALSMAKLAAVTPPYLAIKRLLLVKANLDQASALMQAQVAAGRGGEIASVTNNPTIGDVIKAAFSSIYQSRDLSQKNS
jgi:hypothetical protein